MKNKDFKKIIEDSFLFLNTEYNFNLINVDDDDDYLSLIYKNQTTGVKITYEYRDANIFVYLYKLQDGQLVEDKTPISKELPLHSIELSYIIQYRNPERLTKPLYDSSVKSFDVLVEAIAENLKVCADDVLKGDFDIFIKLDDIAKKRRLEWQEKHGM